MPPPARPQPSHFLALPLVTRTSLPLLKAAVERFAAEAVAVGGELGGQGRSQGQRDRQSTKQSHVKESTSLQSQHGVDPLDVLLGQIDQTDQTDPKSQSHSTPGPGTGTEPVRESRDDGDSLRVIPPRALRPATVLHFTLGVMSLKSADKIAEARQFLQGLDVRGILARAGDAGTLVGSRGEERWKDGHEDGDAKAGILKQDTAVHESRRAEHDRPPHQDPDSGPREEQLNIPSSELPASTPSPIQLRLRGLHPMQSPSATRVLYFAPEDLPSPGEESTSSGRLLRFAQALRDTFQHAGLLIPEDRALKLHATVVNMTYVRERRSGGDGRAGEGGREKGKAKVQKKGTVDATRLIERWKDEVWADVKLEKVAICEMGAKKGEDGELRYREIASVDLPV